MATDPDIAHLAGEGILVLRGTLGSPFTRKVRMASQVLGLSQRIELVRAQPSNEADPLRTQNPIGKMPTLLLPDGTAIYDSPVILEFLQALAGTDSLIPANGMARIRVLTRMALADGIMDAGLLISYESRWRSAEQRVEKWMHYQQEKMMRGYAAFAAEPPDPSTTDAVCIGLSCALAYADWRQQVDWRAQFPKLVDWLEVFAQAEPAFTATAIPPGYGQR